MEPIPGKKEPMAQVLPVIKRKTQITKIHSQKEKMVQVLPVIYETDLIS